MTDYSKLTDEKFQEECAKVYAEQERRSKLASIPSEVQKLSQDFEAIGGDKADLITKINEVQNDTETSTEPIEPSSSDL